MLCFCATHRYVADCGRQRATRFWVGSLSSIKQNVWVGFIGNLLRKPYLVVPAKIGVARFAKDFSGDRVEICFAVHRSALFDLYPSHAYAGQAWRMPLCHPGRFASDFQACVHPGLNSPNTAKDFQKSIPQREIHSIERRAIPYHCESNWLRSHTYGLLGRDKSQLC